MLAPSKTTLIVDSIFYKSSILGKKIKSDVYLIELFEDVRRDFRDVSEFIEALELLFILGKIVFDEKKGVLKIA